MTAGSFFKQLKVAVFALFFVCSLTVTPHSLASQQQRADDDDDEDAVEIENFGKVNDRFYRGAQPRERDFKRLAALGVKTIVDLRSDALPRARAAAEHAGLQYLNLPLRDKQCPPDEAASQFLKIVNDPANWPVYVHCKGGRHRTGAMTAVYRITVDGWNDEQAYQEMKQYDFYTRWGHQCFKDYVSEYYRNFNKTNP